MRRAPLPLLAAAMAVLLSLQSAAVSAQGVSQRSFLEGMRTGIGYTATPPHVLAGVSAFRFLGTGPLGVLVDFKMTLPTLRNDDRFCPGEPAIVQCSISWVQSNRPSDEFQRTRKEYMLINAGVLYALTHEFAVTVGAGAARRSFLHEFWDNPDNIQYPRVSTATGIYLVEDDPAREWVPQAMAGVLMRAGRNLVFRFGYESAPGSISLGFYIVP